MPKMSQNIIETKAGTSISTCMVSQYEFLLFGDTNSDGVTKLFWIGVNGATNTYPKQFDHLN